MDDALSVRLTEALDDPSARAVREQTCQALASAFREVGRLLWVGGSIIGPDRAAGRSPFQFGSDAVVGLATVAQVAGELTAGAVTLLQQDNLYGGAALIRQLVEAEYLAWAFAEDQDEAATWLRSTREDRLKLWQPRRLRERSGGRFRAVDYGRHCDRGGHPTPDAIALLPDHSKRESPSWWWFDLASHGVSTWGYIEIAVDQFDWLDQVHSLETARAVPNRIERWRHDDPLHELWAEIAEMRRANNQE